MRVNSVQVKFTETLNLEVLLPSLETQKWYETDRKMKCIVHLENTTFLHLRKRSSSSMGRG